MSEEPLVGLWKDPREFYKNLTMTCKNNGTRNRKRNRNHRFDGN